MFELTFMFNADIWIYPINPNQIGSNLVWLIGFSGPVRHKS